MLEVRLGGSWYEVALHASWTGMIMHEMLAKVLLLHGDCGERQSCAAVTWVPTSRGARGSTSRGARAFHQLCCTATLTGGPARCLE